MNYKLLLTLIGFVFVCYSVGYSQLPDDFPGLTVHQYGETAEGNVFLTVSTDISGVGYYVFMIDNEGNVQGYKELEEDYSYDFKMQPNGLLTYAQFLSHHTYTGGGNCVHMLLDQEMNEIGSYQMKNGYIAEAHDFQILPNGHVLMFGYYMTQMDLTEVVDGGYPDAKVSGGVIQELDDEGNVIFQWKSWDHYAPEEYDWRRADRQTVSAFHLNTINMDVDGNIIFATPGFTKKLSRQTGEIMWHLGGNENEFDFIGVDSTTGVGQVTGHAFYRLKNGNFLIYDNAGRGPDNPDSEVHEYKIDEEGKTAELIWTYNYPTPIGAWHRGNAYRMPNGNTIIGWGGASGDTIPTCTEIDPEGNILFEVYFDKPEVESYRAFRFPMGDWKVAEALVTELGLGNKYEFLQGDTLDTGIEVELTSMTGGGYNEVVVATFDQAPKFPYFEGKDPRLTAQRVTMDPAYFYFGGKIYFDVEIFDLANPGDITIYFRETEGDGEFVPLNTTYNFVTGNIIADFTLDSTQRSEFVFGYDDLQPVAYSPVLNTPGNGSEVYHSEVQRLEWSPKGLFTYFAIEIATDTGFNNIVYQSDSLSETYVDVEVENNTSYYWRVKTFVEDYEELLESDWSDVSVFHSTGAGITVLEPAAEVKWQYGLEHFIEWEDNFADDVVIELLTDTSQTVLDTTGSDGAYKWSIPVDTEIGCRYRVRVSNVDDPSVYSISPYYFSITDTTGNDGCFESIVERSLIGGVAVFPNPASSTITLLFSLDEPAEGTIHLTDIHGRRKLLFKGHMPKGENHHVFSLKDMHSGIYLLQVKVSSSQVSSKFIINH